MRKLFYLLLLSFFFSGSAGAQTMMPLPAHDAVYSTYARGFWFIAPVSFTITGLRVPTVAGTGAQYIHVMKCHDAFPVATTGSTNFTTLAYIAGAPNGVIQSVNIQVQMGDTIGMMGTAFQANSYSADGIHMSTIAGFPVNLTRFGYQGDIDAGPAPEYWGEAANTSGKLGLVEMYYVAGPCTDPPTPGTATASATSVCPGTNVTLNLTGNTAGAGQTYVWESSIQAGPFIPFSTSSTTATLAVSPATDIAYRAAVTCGVSTTYSAPVNITMAQGVAGSATASQSVVCPGTPVQLNLTGNSTNVGQTYVWESSPNVGGPFTSVSASLTTPSYTVNPTANLWYRAAVTCGPSVTYSVPVNISMSGGSSGTFIVDAGALPGPGVFPSLSSALAAIGCGVTGPVTIDIVANSGPYNEQVTIPTIGGTSASNPLTINGNGNTITFTPISSARHILKLDGADYITINNLNLVSLSPTYGWGIHFTNGADHNTISNCTINLNAVTSTTSTNSAGIVASASATSAVTLGNNGNYNLFTGNTITGGYRGVSWMGNATGLNAVGNSFVNNTIQDFYADGFYMEENDGTSIISNHIQRPNRTNETTGSAIEANTGNRNLLIKGNRIHDTHTNASSGTFYGIYFTGCDAPLGMENKVINNLMYKFNSASGTAYALYNSNSDGAWYYHNTIVLDHAAATGGATRGVYQTGAAANIQLKNNIFYITRGGTGAKYVLYFNTATSTIASNNNDLYINAPAGTNYVGYYGSAQATLTNWKAVNSGAYDQQSVSIDPLFLSAASGDYTPTNLLLDNAGQPLGVGTDILGSPRSGTTPDLGSYEFLTVPSPLAVKLTSFTGERKGENVLLSWNVSSEEGLAEYVVERSLNARNFVEVGKTNAEGKALYNFTDRNAVSSAINDKLYYRLKMVESNGKIAYSNTALINLKASAETFSVYPNPFTEHINITATATESGKCTIKIKDITGRTVVSQSKELSPGVHQIEVSGLNKLAQGTYKVVADINGKIKTATLVK